MSHQDQAGLAYREMIGFDLGKHVTLSHEERARREEGPWVIIAWFRKEKKKNVFDAISHDPAQPAPHIHGPHNPEDYEPYVLHTHEDGHQGSKGVTFTPLAVDRYLRKDQHVVSGRVQVAGSRRSRGDVLYLGPFNIYRSKEEAETARTETQPLVANRTTEVVRLDFLLST